ncbi:transcriptional regulator [Asticcacaulis sp. DW145]|uniref:helix-turn-helix domain-containing protein n=1 Tax=unclassified Asticcacaulis TaxID=2628350 RepID=UPI003085CA48|nr:transcriptional regulator [Asticcacaulis sp. DW145]
MDIRPIKNDDDHASALEEMKGLWNAAEGTPEHDQLAIMITLVHDYEERRWPIAKNLDPVQAIEAAMEAEGRTQSDLANLIGKSRATEILRRKRPLTLAMIRKLNKAWHIPADRLVQEYDLSA